MNTQSPSADSKKTVAHPSLTAPKCKHCTVEPATDSILDDQPVTITREQAARAFADWENDVRTYPSNFYTPEETAKLEVCSLSEGRAICLFAYARQAAA